MKNTAPFHDTQTYPYPKPVTVVRVTHQEKYKYNLKTLVEAIEQKGKGTLAPQIKEGDIFFSALVSFCCGSPGQYTVKAERTVLLKPPCRQCSL